MSEPLNSESFVPPPPPTTHDVVPAPRPTKLRVPAIVLFAVGLLVLVGGIAKFIAGGLGTGAALAFFGIVLFGLSFVPLPQVQTAEAPMSPVEKILGVFFEPARVFRNLRAYPYWVAPYLLICVLTAAYTFAFTQRITPERIVNYTMDKVAEMGPPLAPSPEQLETARAQQLEAAKDPLQRVGAAAKTFVGAFVVSGLIAALYMLAVLAFGGRIHYWQSLAVIFYSFLPIVIIQKVLSLVILYIKSPDDLHPILGQETLVQDNLGILINRSDHPVLFVMAAYIGVLSIYGLWLRAKGLQNGGTRVSSSAAWGAAITMWVLGLFLATVFAALFPMFIQN